MMRMMKYNSNSSTAVVTMRADVQQSSLPRENGAKIQKLYTQNELARFIIIYIFCEKIVEENSPSFSEFIEQTNLHKRVRIL
jgi:hypothetical protein